MAAQPVFELLLRDLVVWAWITFFVGLVMAIVAVPVTFMAKNGDEFGALPVRLLRNWRSGVMNTVGSWIVLTGLFEFLLQLATKERLATFDAVAAPLVLGYLMCLIVSIRIMWRNANSPAPPPRRTFSLATLIWIQVILLVVCGCWVALRRQEIQQHHLLQADQNRQAAS